MDKKQQKALQKYADSLAQLITRLSTFFEGANTAIDDELKVLRGHLAGHPNFTLAEVSMQKLTPLLMDGNKQVRHQIKENVSELQTKIKKIQQLDGASATFRRSVAQLLTTLSLPTGSLTQLHGHFFSATRLLEEAISGAQVKSKYNAYASKAPAESENAGEIKNEILVELQQLVDVYAKRKPDDPQLHELRELLEQGIDEKQLLESCLILIRLIVSETMLDASANGKIVQSIYTAISHTNRQLNEGISISQAQFDRNTDQHDHLQDMLGEIDANIDQESDIESLKDKAHQQINRIRTELSDKHEADKHDQERLMSLLVDMQDQLNSLQKQAQNYKKRLVEQKASLYTDPLTKVPNRLAYNERASKAMEFAKQQKEPLALAVIDVDHFKNINDKYGHAAGDRTLQVIARHLKKNLRPNEFLARWGGEEFALLMQNQSSDGLAERLDALRQSLSELPFKFKQTPVKITASFGASCYQYDSDETLQQFFERADDGLYTAKENGRNCVVVNN